MLQAIRSGLSHTKTLASKPPRFARKPSSALHRRHFFRSSIVKDTVYTFGENSEAQCAQLKLEPFDIPMKVSEIDPNLQVESITCSWQSNFLKAKDGRLYSWGHNGFGHLGLPGKGMHPVRTPSEVVLLQEAEKHQVVASRAHTVVIINEPPQVVTMGMCDFGQLGIGRTTEQPLVWPQLVSTLDKIRVIKVVAGMDHTAALGSLGQVYTWGLGGYGQTGIGRADNQMLATPTLVPNIPPLYKLFAGADHTGGVDVDGNLWVWGSNMNGQLGVTELELFGDPIQSDWDASRKIDQIVGGGQHTLVLTDTGEVWAVGRGDEGALGLGEGVKKNHTEWTKIKYFEDRGKKVKMIAAGFGHSVAITDDGRLYVWGLNSEGQLGLGDRTSRYEPVENEYFADRNLKGVACGTLHTVVWGDYNIL